jgi:ARG/rhodanese/phosphatase superfamily protein
LWQPARRRLYHATDKPKFSHRPSHGQPSSDGTFRASLVPDIKEGFMRCSLVAFLSPLVVSAFATFNIATAQEAPRVSGPVTHENLTVYFIRGTSTPGKVPLTLEEAMAKQVVQVRETGNVNQLEIENTGGDDVFIQSGDIVKGGQQDRVLMVSLVLPPKSGRVPIASFCVEQGRWSARGREDVKQFSTASASLPSRELKLAMKAPRPAAGGDALRAEPADTSARQRAVWEGVSQTQARLSAVVGAPVRSNQSASSLQLALENEKLVDQQRAYVAALKSAGEAPDDIVGYVFAVNGKLNSADIYPSNALFRKMWAKLLNASTTEAISHKDEPRADAPSIEAVTTFLAAAESGRESQKPLVAGAQLRTRDGEQAYLFETARQDGWVHRNYLAK